MHRAARSTTATCPGSEAERRACAARGQAGRDPAPSNRNEKGLRAGTFQTTALFLLRFAFFKGIHCIVPAPAVVKPAADKAPRLATPRCPGDACSSIRAAASSCEGKDRQQTWWDRQASELRAKQALPHAAEKSAALPTEWRRASQLKARAQRTCRNRVILDDCAGSMPQSESGREAPGRICGGCSVGMAAYIGLSVTALVVMEWSRLISDSYRIPVL